LGYDRVIVCNTPGTTRDAIDTPITFKDQPYILIDTAGIRRKSRIGFNLEKYSVFEAFRALRRCDVGLLIIDAEAGITEQDAKIAGQIYNRGKACVVVVNKWDLIQKDNATVGEYVRNIKDKTKFLDFAPIVFVSALTGQRTAKILDKASECFKQFQRRTSTGDLNQFLTQATRDHPPPLHRGKQIKFYYVTQGGIKPPTFIFFTNFPHAIHFSYERYLSNRLREQYGFEGTPLRLFFRGRNAKDTPNK
jgi:GTP-binding protein